MSTALMFINPFLSHIKPNISLVKELVKQGEHIIFFTTKEFSSLVSEITNVEVYPEREDLFDWGIEVKIESFDEAIKKILLYYERFLTGHFKFLQEFASEKMKQYRPDYIIYDYFDAAWAKFAAIGEHIKYISSSPTYAINSKIFEFAPHDFIKYVWRIPDSLPIFKSNKSVRNFASLIEHRICHQFGLSEFKLFEIGNSPYLNIIHTSRSLQPYAALFDSTYGFSGYEVDWKTNHQMDIILSEDKPVVCFALGLTIRSHDPELCRLCIEALGDADVQVVMSIGRYISVGDLGCEIPKNFIVRAFIPQFEVLRHSDIFITHAGQNSVNEALLNGVSLVCIPIQTDQFINAKVVVEKGAGICLERQGITANKIKYAVERLLASGTARQNSSAMGYALMNSGGSYRAAQNILRLK